MCTDYTVTDLQPVHEYDVNICPLLNNGSVGQPSNTIHIQTLSVSEIFDITKFGAVGDGRDAVGRAIGITSERIRITNCKFISGLEVAIGSEMSGGVRDVLVQDCDFDDVYSVATIRLFAKNNKLDFTSLSHDIHTPLISLCRGLLLCP